jgi:hypothetical protein
MLKSGIDAAGRFNWPGGIEWRQATGPMTAGEVTMTTMVVEIQGRDLPGRRCGQSPDGGSYDNIHVGIVRRADTIELVPGDAPSARWQLEVTVRRGADGTIDFAGPFVHGKRGERHLGLRWGR